MLNRLWGDIWIWNWISCEGLHCTDKTQIIILLITFYIYLLILNLVEISLIILEMKHKYWSYLSHYELIFTVLERNSYNSKSTERGRDSFTEDDEAPYVKHAVMSTNQWFEKWKRYANFHSRAVLCSLTRRSINFQR